MLQRIQLTITDVLTNPQARVMFVVGTLILAALASGAPSDWGGH